MTLVETQRQNRNYRSPMINRCIYIYFCLQNLGYKSPYILHYNQDYNYCARKKLVLILDITLAITGCDIDVSNIVNEPPRYGPTVWEIEIPDRSAAEFFVPDLNPKYINKLYVGHPDRFRQYRLWERYKKLYPKEDLVFTIDVSDYKIDWFFAHVTRIKGTRFEVVVQNEEMVEVSFTRKWDSSLQPNIVPIDIDKRFIMRKDVTRFYSYAIFEHLAEWPAFNLPQTRIVFKLHKDKFRYMAIADNRQRKMPLPEDRLGKRGRALAYPEAVLLVHPVEEEFKGEVDDKYEYSCENKDLKVHGWISHKPGLGCWQIIPSNEFRSGGLSKQNLTSHVGPISLAMFLSAHYAGEDMVMKVKAWESWKKVFGPVFTYLNSLPDQISDPLSLWQDAKNQMLIEVQSWPYDFPASEDFAVSAKRGCISGRLLVRDNDELLPANGAFVGLAPPGEVGFWQTESKGYQFWTEADADGYFVINNIREGEYGLNAYVAGWIGDYQYEQPINITAGCDIDVSNIVYEPPRDGPTVWEIGIPDRSAAEFFVPDPNPKYINKLYVGHPNRFRQYGLWERYTELYPKEDLVFTIDVSDYKTDWFFAHVTKKIGDDTYQKTTWQIKFKLEEVQENSIYKIRIALATANVAELHVRMNEYENEQNPLFTTGVIGHDNAIARHGIHGIYRLYNVDVPSEKLVQGDNTLFLTQAMTTTGAFNGLMYDYIRFEGPPLDANLHISSHPLYI